MSAYERVDLLVATDSSSDESIESNDRNESPQISNTTWPNYQTVTPPKDLIKIQWSRNSGIALAIIGGFSTMLGT